MKAIEVTPCPCFSDATQDPLVASQTLTVSSSEEVNINDDGGDAPPALLGSAEGTSNGSKPVIDPECPNIAAAAEAAASPGAVSFFTAGIKWAISPFSIFHNLIVPSLPPLHNTPFLLNVNLVTAPKCPLMVRTSVGVAVFVIAHSRITPSFPPLHTLPSPPTPADPVHKQRTRPEEAYLANRVFIINSNGASPGLDKFHICTIPALLVSKGASNGEEISNPTQK